MLYTLLESVTDVQGVKNIFQSLQRHMIYSTILPHTMSVFAYSSPEISKSWYCIFQTFSPLLEGYYHGLSEYV